MIALELRYATVCYPVPIVRAAVVAALRERPARGPGAPDFGAVVRTYNPQIKNRLQEAKSLEF